MSSLANLTFSPPGPIPYMKEYLMSEKVLYPLWLVMLPVGLAVNVINILVFLKAGVKDSVSVLLLSLPMSDLVFFILNVPSSVSYFIRVFAPSHHWPFSSSILVVLFYWPAFTVYDVSTAIAVSLGVMRCACVAMPLKFKHVFTRSRTWKWVLFLVVLSFAMRGPALSIHRLAWKLDPATNTSVAFVLSVNSVEMARINDIMNRGFVIFITFFTMVACVIILTYKLYETSKIRRISRKTPSVDNKSASKTEEQGLSTKDLQVVKCVVLVCVIFILSQLTFLISSSIRLFDPTKHSFQKAPFLFSMISRYARTSSFINASVNIFVYYNFNSKFRAVFRSLFFMDKQL